MIQVVCKTNSYKGSHQLQRPLWKGNWSKEKPGFGFPNLTPGKIYQAYGKHLYNNIGENGNYRLVDDSGSSNVYPKSIFVTLEEFREEKIRELFNCN
jgi:hypothetical protein